jgi:hypothetical protein
MEDACFKDSPELARVRAWLRTPDFRICCEFADLRIDWVRKAFFMILSAQSEGEAKRIYWKAKEFISICELS